jgi:ABC-type nitrate/sulfonate/bicarbonate transport system permease component
MAVATGVSASASKAISAARLSTANVVTLERLVMNPSALPEVSSGAYLTT